MSGNTLVFSTYLGGSNTDVGFGIAADGSGNAYVSGMTLSSNFPTYNALQPSLGGNYDAFITKLNPNGSTIIYSTYLGGSGGDCTTYPPCAVAVDDAGNAYVTGNTDSPNFILRNPLQGSKGGLEDVFITKIHSSGTQLVFSTYLGGSSDDWSHGLAIDSVGNVYVTGGTRSSNFPIKSPVQTTYGGGEDDAFVAKLSLDGRNLLYSTYLGGSSFDKGLSIATDSAGNAYIVGTTQSEDFPTVNALQSTLHGGENAFVTKISSGSGSPPDTTPPTGEISAPAEGSTVTPASESVRIAATASDNTSGSGIKEVEFQVLYDGQWHVVGVDTTAPYEVTWNLPANLRSQRIGFGIHITDNAGNTNMNLNGIRRVTFNDLRSNWVSNRAYLNQLALGPNGDQMCSMSSIAMVRAQAGLIGKDFSSLRDEANRVWNTGLRGPRPSQVANYLNGNGMQASVIWNQNKDAHWSQIKSEIDAGRPIILNSQPAANGGRLTIGGHYIVVVGYREAANPTERQIIAYDPYGRWTSGTSRYARSINSTSPDPPDGTVGRWVFYTFNDLGTIYSVTARRTSVAIAESEPGSPPDEINVADHEEIVTYVGDGQSYPIQVYLPTAIR